MKSILKPCVVMLGIIVGTAAANTVYADDSVASQTVASQTVASQTVESQTLASGGFTKIGQRTTGTWTLETRADGVYAVLSDDFKARKAPDLKIFLHTAEPGKVNGKNAADGLFVAALKSHKGGQAYKLPAGIDLADYKSFVIHCQQYSKFWAAGSIA